MAALKKDTDPFEEGKAAATSGTPAEANPYTFGTDDYALWHDGHELQASSMEADESEG
jgi:hypothetical protein